ncbi:MAG TPA: sigma-70 family RNA polymerase sigma factor [Nitrosopumilaceae archaeon]|jgi:RNA polymerase sigma-70 factor (family 1)|nr:sigma-70 family RNA polymerase sigma factor [Nitrosopumilaceae archaeon]
MVFQFAYDFDNYYDNIDDEDSNSNNKIVDIEIDSDFKGTSYKKNGKPLKRSIETEEKLISLFNSGHQAAFTTIYKKLYPNIYYFAKRFVNSEDAADMTSEVFLKLWNMQKSFRSLKSIKVFLQVSVRNASLNRIRNAKVSGKRLTEMAYLSGTIEKDSFQNEEMIAELVRKLYLEIENLPLPIKRVLKMSYLEGMKDKKIAEFLKISITTVYNQKSKALNMLRLALLQSCLLLLSNLFPKNILF